MKLFSTFACDCEGDNCTNECWFWQRAELEHSLDDWVKANPSKWFGISNLCVESDSGVYVRDSGYAKFESASELVDFFVLASNVFSIRYGSPGGDEWQFEQMSLFEETGRYEKCKVFWASER